MKISTLAIALLCTGILCVSTLAPAYAGCGHKGFYCGTNIPKPVCKTAHC